MKTSSLCYLIKDNRVLLAKKKRGFGVGKWNGVGGKINPGENIEETALRELKEEIGILASIRDLESMGLIRFRSENKEYNWNSHLFFLKNWEGNPSESEEIYPDWYSYDSIPYELMFPDDVHWFPMVLSGKKIDADFRLDKEGKNIIDFSIREIV